MPSGKHPQDLTNLGIADPRVDPHAREHSGSLGGEADFVDPPLAFDAVGCRHHNISSAH